MTHCDKQPLLSCVVLCSYSWPSQAVLKVAQSLQLQHRSRLQVSFLMNALCTGLDFTTLLCNLDLLASCHGCICLQAGKRTRSYARDGNLTVSEIDATLLPVLIFILLYAKICIFEPEIRKPNLPSLFNVILF